ncbi:hypothetical protein [Pseudoxanthomonas composti]|uniref:Uncharacterized protein n=1 Tax=Pseudoxanthomonas composti TaxID=2137479 RepID=A0A4V1N0W4_9GAMM|nr:hypothetical protein [Pseudoxanthomonas composti]RXR03459.1 hypothetical protein EPA99_13565 [Pseudoxanthomonas composti]
MKASLSIIGVSLMLLALLWPALAGFLPLSYDGIAGEHVHFRLVPAQDEPEYLRWSFAVLGLVFGMLGIKTRSTGK